MRNFRKLSTWQLARKICSSTYRETQDFPRDEQFGLRRQMRRAAISIASNIAEGASRESGADFRRFLYIAKGSAAELETQLVVASDLGYVDLASDSSSQLLENLGQTQAMLGRLIQAVTREIADAG